MIIRDGTVTGQTYYLRLFPYETLTSGVVSSNYSLTTSFVPTTTTGISVLYPFAGTFAVSQTPTGTYSHTDDPTNVPNPDYWTAAYDFDAPSGTPVLAVASGRVVSVYETTADGQFGPGHGQGNFITILYNPGAANQFYGTFAHLSNNSVLPVVGQSVIAGELVAFSGLTGASTGAHIHFGYSTTMYTHPTSTTAVPIIFANATDCNDGLVNFGGVRPILNQSVTGQFTGGSGTDALTGNSAANAIVGYGGVDTINGLGGNDFIYGGLGNDILTGGAGRDTFVFNTAVSAAIGSINIDTITDFSVVDDAIHLSRAIFTAAGTAGQLASGAFNFGSAALQADDRIIYNCSIPDDHIDPRRSAFFMAKSILRDIRSGMRTC